MSEQQEPDGFAFQPDQRDLAGAHAPSPIWDGEEPVTETLAATGAADSKENFVGARGDGTGRYVALAVISLLTVVTVTGVTGKGCGGGDGASALKRGEQLAPFAAPLATGNAAEEADVNVATADNQGDRGAVAACKVSGPNAVNSCDLIKQGPLVIVTFTPVAAAGPCQKVVTSAQALTKRYPKVQVLAIATGSNRTTSLRSLQVNGWKIPVAYDHDGALSARLGGVACPAVISFDAKGRLSRRLVGKSATPEEIQRSFAVLQADPNGQKLKKESSDGQ